MEFDLSAQEPSTNECCGITTAGGLTRDQAESNAVLLKAVADATIIDIPTG